MGFVETIIEKYPKYTIAILLIYGLAITGASSFSFVYNNYHAAKKPYLEALFKYCDDVSDIVARIGSSSTFSQQKIDDFNAYYFGRLVLVENTDVAKQMIAFRSQIAGINEQNYAQYKEKLHNPALSVSGACRDLIKETWSLSIVPWRDLQKKE